MKINQYIFRFKKQLLVLSFAIICSANFYAQDETVVIEKNIRLKDQPNISINIYEARVDILPSNTNEVKVKLEYRAEGKDEEKTKLKAKLESDLLSSTGNQATIDLSFQSSYDLEIMGMKWSRLTFKSDNKESIKLKEFKIEQVKIWIPQQCELSLNSKYAAVQVLTNIDGNCKIDIYDTQLTTMDTSEKLSGKAKYSKLKVGDNSSSMLELYECKFQGGETKTSHLKSKYSNISFANLETLELEIYEGALSVNEVVSLNINSKYADLKLGEVQTLTLDAYEGKCAFESIDKLSLKAKYVDIAGGTINQLEMLEAYENNLAIEKLNTLLSENGKYNTFAIGTLYQSVELSGYEDEIEIGALSGAFKSVKLSGKYIDARLSIQSPKAYRLFGEVKYPDFDLNDNLYHIRKKIGDSDHLEIDYSFRNVQDSSPTIELNGYEMNFSLNHN